MQTVTTKTAPEYLNIARQYVEREKRAREATAGLGLVADLADAIEALLLVADGAGTSLPRYLRLDLDAIRALVERAREEVSGEY